MSRKAKKNRKQWIQFCCQNPDCELYGQKGLGNLHQHGFSDQAHTIPMLRCRQCKKEFSARKGTPLFGSRLAVEKVEQIGAHLAEGDGIRKTARLTKVAKETVQRYSRLLGQHGKALHDEQVRHVTVQEAQMDEAWSFVGKKRPAV